MAVEVAAAAAAVIAAEEGTAVAQISSAVKCLVVVALQVAVASPAVG